MSLVSIHDLTARVTATQCYVNDSTYPIQFVYTHRLPSSKAAVVSFQATMEGKTTTGSLIERDEFTASEEFRDKESLDTFRCTIGWLEEGREVTLTMTYVCELGWFEDRVRFGLYHVGNDQTILFSADIDTSSNLLKILENPDFHINGNTATGLIRPNSYFHLDVIVRDAHSPVALVESDGHGGSVVSFAFHPNFKKSEGEEMDLEIIFLIDCSENAVGCPMGTVNRAMELVLHALPSGCHFNVYDYGSTWRQLFPCSTRYDPNSFLEALEVNLTRKPNLGPCKLYNVLDHVLRKDVRKGSHRSIFLLMTGRCEEKKEGCIDLARLCSHRNRVFTLGIGESPEEYLLRSIAEKSGGQAEMISWNELERGLLEQVQRGTRHYISDLKMDWGQLRSLHPKILSSGSRLPNLFEGEHVITYLNVDADSLRDMTVKKVTGTLRGKMNGRDFTQQMTVNLEENSRSPDRHRSLARLCGKILIERLEISLKPSPHGMSLGWQRQLTVDPQTQEPFIQKIREISMKTGVVSSFTCYVPADESTGKIISESASPVNFHWNILCEGFELSPSPSPSPKIGGKPRHQPYGLLPPLSPPSQRNSRRLGTVVMDLRGSSSLYIPPPPLVHPNKKAYDTLPLLPDATHTLSPVDQRASQLFDLYTKLADTAAEEASPFARSQLCGILLCQNPSGKFERHVTRWLGTTMKRMKKRRPYKRKKTVDLFVTAVTVAYLREKVTGWEEVWGLAVRKAEEWLKREAVACKTNQERLMQAARRYIIRYTQ
ncbi:hypothetical protein PROFUN_00460 [Planoprotostelium fungivorum]|uniref:VWFA domain-containing protein n=1 Tax=Planoprotostelium fungivorum TaxID=1890364 RepID=A0A2P6N0V8_9EUKA|nr:hypothetical protein PROFUN_00460 [Planoprotostelium fungivorum]